ncbi:hypothetical protein C9374_006345 [Naegleria lovaniensis]|uniref:DH domain-containing protein n=1 Tax=Naegleria lovaniensis TaxID=51637 RepID=A0AA88GLK2_NAELO|nr:uncharacterized protein C9374_006345 [Naegleria lovaniensis]KAG2381356.1 hypothetical protein C9374_006345 [Naegleria lovaniensis]
MSISSRLQQILDLQKKGDIANGHSILVQMTREARSTDFQKELLDPASEALDDLCLMLSNKEMNFKFIVVNILATVASLNPKLCQEIVKRSDTVDEMISIAREHKNMIQPVRDVTAFLRNAALTADNKSTLTRFKCHEMAATLLAHYLKNVKQAEFALDNCCAILALLVKNDGELAFMVGTTLNVIPMLKTILSDVTLQQEAKEKTNPSAQRLVKSILQLYQYLCHFSNGNHKTLVESGGHVVLSNLIGLYQSCFEEASTAASKVLHIIGQTHLISNAGGSPALNEESITGIVNDLKSGIPAKQKKACELLWEATEEDENIPPFVNSEIPDLLIGLLESEYLQILEPSTGALSNLVRDPAVLVKMASKKILSILSAFIKQETSSKLVLNAVAICVYIGNSRTLLERLSEINFASICSQTFDRFFQMIEIKEVGQVEIQILMALLKLFSNFARTKISAIELKETGIVDTMLRVIMKEPTRQNFEIRKSSCETLYNLYNVDEIRDYIDSIEGAMGYMTDMIGMIDLSNCDRILSMKNNGATEDEIRQALDDDNASFKPIDNDAFKLASFDDDDSDDDDSDEDYDEDLEGEITELRPSTDEELLVSELEPEDDEDLNELQPSELEPADDDELQPSELEPASLDSEPEELEASVLDEELELQQEMERRMREEEEENKRKEEEERIKNEEKERRKEQRRLQRKEKRIKEMKEKQKEEEEEEKKKEKRAAKRKAISRELLSTEESYVKALDACRKIYMERIVTAPKTIIPKDKFDVIFKDIDLIYKVNFAFLTKLKALFHNEEDLWENVEYKIGELVLSYAPSFKTYCSFVNNYDRAEAMMFACIKQYKPFADFLDQISNELLEQGFRQTDLGSFLIQPVQRLPRYNLLLTDLMKNSDNTESTGYKILKRALGEVQSITNFVNEAKRGVEYLAMASKLLEKLQLSLPDNPDRKWIHTEKKLRGYVYEKRKELATKNKAPYIVALHILSDYAIVKRKKGPMSNKVHVFNLKYTRIRRKAADMDKDGLSMTLEDEEQSKLTPPAMEFEVKFPSKEMREEILTKMTNIHLDLLR